MNEQKTTNRTTATAEEFIRHVLGDEEERILITFTGRQARLENPEASFGALVQEGENAVDQRYWRYPEQLSEAVAYLREESERGRDAYFTVSPFKEAGNRRADNVVDDVSCLRLDFDAGYKDAEAPKNFPDATALAVSSPGSYHLYFRLARPVPKEKAAELSRRLARWTDSDVSLAANTTVMRTPGTVNYKRHPETHEVEGVITGVEAHDPDELEWLLPPESASKPKKEYTGDPEDGFSLEEWFDAFPEARMAMLGEFRDEKARIKYQTVCPWASEHTTDPEGGTYVGQFPDGHLFFHCNHGHCVDKRKWREYRAFYDPECEAAARVAKLRAENLVERVREADEDAALDLIFEDENALRTLARLSTGGLATIRSKLKKTLGSSLDLNELAKAVKEEKAREERERRERRVAGGAGGLPVVETEDRPLRDRTRDTIKALVDANDPPLVFQRGGALARVRVDEDDRATIQPVGEAALRNRMTAVADFIAVGKSGPRHVSPPLDIVHDVLAQVEPPFPPLESIVGVPVLRPDGTVLTEPGYDATTRLLYRPDAELRVPDVPEEPTTEDVRAALAKIEEAVGEFPYDAQADWANALGLLLTPVVRQAVRGHVPMALLDAPDKGTGKTLLGEVVCTVTTGSASGLMSEVGSEEEWRKQITSVLAEGRTVVTVDNLTLPLKSAQLAKALTSEVWSDRVLGRSEILNLRQRATWVATGNNIRIGDDMLRRVYRVRLDARVGKPWTRKAEEFTHPDLLGWVRENRGELLAALLTVARSWFAAGCPEPKHVPVMGSFDEWVRVIGGILENAGVEGFLTNLDSLQEEAGGEAEEWEAFLAEWHRAFGSKQQAIGEVSRYLADDGRGMGQGYKALKEAAPDEVLAEAGRDNFPQLLGQMLRSRMKTRYGAYHIEKGTPSHGKPRWKVVKIRRDDEEESGGGSVTVLPNQTGGHAKEDEGEAEEASRSDAPF